MLVAALTALSLQPTAATPVEYVLSFDNAAHREASITVSYRDLPEGQLVLRMARSSPGRYALHEFAKNVDDVSAVDGAGRPLKVERPDPYSWIVEGHDGAVTVSYTLFADRADGTYAQVDPSHAHLNGPASLMWAEGTQDRNVVVRIDPYADNWKVATQLFPTADPYVFTAPDFHYLMDSPIEVSDHEMREWQVAHKGETATIQLAVHSNLSDALLDGLEKDVRALVDEQIRFWDDLPDFDTGTYTFLVDYLPWISGDGMEHRNSTVISGPRSDSSDRAPGIGVYSHEFFHAWNVERLRPADLEPFDFTQADVSSHLWLGEGFTNHVDGIILHRAGVEPLETTLGGLAGAINSIARSPARPGSSPTEMSRIAPFLDAATSNDPTDYFNSKISYYSYGAAVGLGLDLALRTRFDRDLDGYMRLLWQRFGAPEKPYTDTDLIDTLADYSGDRAFAEDFFARYVHGDQLPDYGPMLEAFGLVLRPEQPGKAWLGLDYFTFRNGRAILDTASLRGSPLYEAGLSRQDEIIAIDGAAIDSQADWDKALGALKPGQETTISFYRRGEEGSATVTVAEPPELEIVTLESTGGTPSSAQLERRHRWLGAPR